MKKTIFIAACILFSLNSLKAQSNKEDIEIAKELSGDVNDKNLFIKHSYSAFKGQMFEKYLKSHAITKVDICGIDLDGCVLATAYDAFDRGYEVKVLYNLSFSRDNLAAAAKSIINRNIQTKNDPRPH